MRPCVCVVWVCVCSCVREFVYVDAYAHLCMHVWRSEVDIRCLSLLFSILFWDAVSHWTCRSLIKIDWLQAHRIFLSLSSWLWDYICTLPGPALCVGAGYLNPVPHACSATIRAFPPFYMHMTIHIVIGGHLLNSTRVQYNHSNIECLLISTTFQVLNSIRPGQDVLRSIQWAKVHFHSWMYIWKLLLSFVIDIVEYTLKGHGQTTLGLLPLCRPMNDALCSGVHVLCNKKVFLRRTVGVWFSLCSGVLGCLF